MAWKILDLSRENDVSELKNGIKKNHLKSCSLINNKNDVWHTNLINEAEKIINLPENNPIKHKSNKSIAMSYWDKWDAVIDTSEYIFNIHKDKPFIDTLLEYLKIDKDKYYDFFITEMLIINASYQTKLLSSELKCLFDYKKYENYFLDIKTKINTGKINNSEIWTLLSPHLLKNLPIDWIKSLKLKHYFGKNIDGKNSFKQGLYNGPDFIFIDKEKNMVGIEVINLAKNFVMTWSNKNADKYFLNAFKNTGYKELLGGGLKQFVDYIREKILEIKQSKNYIKCQRQYLVVIIDSDEIEVGWHEIAEIIINNNSKIRDIYSKVVLI